jgi:hypothetical protein
MKKIKYHIVKFVFSVIGWYKATFVFKEGHKYLGGMQKNAASIYRGNRTFYESFNAVESTWGVCVFTTRNKTYKYWELGIFKWIENNEIEEVTKV